MGFQTLHGTLPAIKNQAFTHYFFVPNPASTPLPGSALTNGTFASLHVVSQDGSAFVSTTNSVTNLTNGFYSLTLTAAEMNGDVILINLRDSVSGNITESVVIYTIPAELTAIPISTDTFGKKLLGLFQYFFNKRAVTASALTMYKADGATTLGTGTITDDGTTVTKGNLS